MIPNIPALLVGLRELCPACANKPAGHCRPEGHGPLCYWCHVDEQRRERQRAAAKRRRDNPRALAGVDIDRAVAAFRKLPALRPLLASALGKRSKIVVQVQHRAAGGCGGRAWKRRVLVFGGPNATAARVLEVALHELCHVALPGHHHDERFRRVFARACREAWGIEVPVDPPAVQGVRAYGQGQIAVELLAPLVESASVATYPPEPARPRPKRDVVAERAEHAAAMLKKAETRLKLARTIRATWAAKVRYYDRAAAKRGSP